MGRGTRRETRLSGRRPGRGDLSRAGLGLTPVYTGDGRGALAHKYLMRHLDEGCSGVGDSAGGRGRLDHGGHEGREEDGGGGEVSHR